MSTPSSRTYDVVVVGARAAGAATAMLLARAGLRVLLLDRGRYGDDTLSTHGLLRVGVQQLARWGLLEWVVAAGTPPVRRTTFWYGEKRIDVPIKPSTSFDALYAPRRTVLDPILVDAAREAGADVRFGVTVTGLCRNETGRVTGVVCRDETGAAFAARARVTVGADGRSSRVARLAGAPVEQQGTGAAASLYGYWDGLAVDGYELFYRPGVTGGMFPTNDGQVCVFACIPRARFHAESRCGVAGLHRRALDEVLPKGLEVSGEVRQPDSVQVYSGRPGFMRQAAGSGWALVGDAGYYKDPITAHGLTDALRDAELLARALLAQFGGEVSEASAQTAYQTTRDRLSRDLFETTDEIASFTWDLDRIPALLLALSQSMQAETRWIAELDAPGAAA